MKWPRRTSGQPESGVQRAPEGGKLREATASLAHDTGRQVGSLENCAHASHKIFSKTFLNYCPGTLEEAYLEWTRQTLFTRIREMRDHAPRSSIGPAPPFPASAWFDAMTTKINLLKNFADRLIESVRQGAR